MKTILSIDQKVSQKSMMKENEFKSENKIKFKIESMEI